MGETSQAKEGGGGTGACGQTTAQGSRGRIRREGKGIQGEKSGQYADEQSRSNGGRHCHPLVNDSKGTGKRPSPAQQGIRQGHWCAEKARGRQGQGQARRHRRAAKKGRRPRRGNRGESRSEAQGVPRQ